MTIYVGRHGAYEVTAHGDTIKLGPDGKPLSSSDRPAPRIDVGPAPRGPHFTPSHRAVSIDIGGGLDEAPSMPGYPSARR